MGLRCFVALEVAPEVRERLAALQEALRKAAPRADVRWVRPETIHLTLAFLGIVPEPLVSEVAAAVRSAAASRPPVVLTMTGLGAFPTPRAPRILWARVADAGEAAERLALAVQAALTPLGYPLETRPFRPHLTLGRVRSSRALRPLVDALKTDAAFVPVPWTAADVVLFRSDTKPTGAVHEPVERVALAG